MRKSFVVFGLGRFGASVAKELATQGADVLAIDMEEDPVAEVAPYVTVATQADIRSSAAMANIALDKMDGAVIAMGQTLDASIIALMACKRVGIKEIWVKANDQMQIEIFRELGATRVFIPEQEQAVSVARSLMSGTFLDLFTLSDKISMIKLPVQPAWAGKTLLELELRRKYGINIIAIQKNGNIHIEVDPRQPLDRDWVLFVMADKNALRKLNR